MLRLLRRHFRLPLLWNVRGLVADNSSNDGLFALANNVNKYCGHLETIVSAGTDTTLTAVQTRRAVLRLTAGASGGFTITLPSTKAIIAELGPTIALDGTYGQRFSILNDGIGQTGTLTVGDASTTITGTATVLTDTRRDFFLTVTSATTVTFQNLGSAAI